MNTSTEAQPKIKEEALNLISETTEISMADAKIIGKGKVTFVNSPVKVFGILFNHAFPLDLSVLKYCFQGCPFCFATANKRAKQDVVGKNLDPTDHFFRLLQKANGQGYNPQSLTEYVLRKKMPVIFSNNVDPFLPASEVDYQIGERVLSECLHYNQRLFIQTKEVYPNDRVKELLIKGKDLFQVYVSLSTLDYDTAKQYETVAITPEERLRRISELTKHGVHVIAALNPYVPEWVNLKEYFKRIADAGCSGVFAFPLHLTATQSKVMPKRFEKYTKLANRYDGFLEDAKLMEQFAKDNGVGFYQPYGSENPNYYKGATAWKLPDVGWPIDAHWLHAHVKNMYLEDKSPVFIHWSAVDKFYSKFPEWDQVFNVNEFAGVLWTDNETYFAVKSALGSKNKIKNIVRFIWNNPDKMDMFLSFFTDCFRLVDGDGTNEAELVYDDSGDLIWVYDPEYKADPYHWDQSDKSVSSLEPTWFE